MFKQFGRAKDPMVFNRLPLVFLLALIAALSDRAEAVRGSRPTVNAYCAATAVLMDHYRLARSGETEFIASVGASTCVLLTLHDPRTRTGAVAHVSAMTDVGRSVAAMLRRFKARGVASRDLQARLIGGWRGWSEAMVADLRRALRRHEVAIVEEDVLVNPGFTLAGQMSRDPAPSEPPFRSIRLDTATGDVADIATEDADRHHCPNKDNDPRLAPRPLPRLE